MSAHRPKHEPAQDEEHPATAGEEVPHEAEGAATSVADVGGRGADALCPNEDAQEDVHHRGA
ncbi:hypothetical protein ACFWM7_26210 [Streptomyces sp. NPDC058375]|uniref:hypothetical protein n=1 Tax=Streptomyces sp. NPDC058375 TaxID=3346467 RepID=UPI0036541565